MTRNILSNLAIVCMRKADSRKREGRHLLILNIPPPPANISGPSLYCTPVSSQAKREEDQWILSVNNIKHHSISSNIQFRLSTKASLTII